VKEDQVGMSESRKADGGRRITGAHRVALAAQLRDKYEQGASIRGLVEQTGRSYGLVHQLLTEAGAPLRGRGGNNRAKTAT
jgi:hypothetical protein